MADIKISAFTDTSSLDGTEKLTGLKAGVNTNVPSSLLLARANHTGTQAISTVTGLQPALDSKTDIGSIQTLVGDTWDLDTQPLVYQAITTDTDYTVSGSDAGVSRGFIVINKTGTGIVTVNSNTYATRDNGKTVLSVIMLPDSSYYVSSDYFIYVLDVTAPVIVSAEATDANTIVFTMSEPVYGTVAGISFENGSPLTISGMTGAGTSTLTFTIVEDMEDTDVITFDVTSSDIVDYATTPNALANDSGTVTNSIVPADTTAPVITSVEAINDHEIEVNFSEIVVGTDDGFSFEANAITPLTISGVTGTGTNKFTFTITETMVNTDALTFDVTGSDIVDTATTPNALANDSGTVTNSIAGTGGFTMLDFTGSTGIVAGTNPNEWIAGGTTTSGRYLGSTGKKLASGTDGIIAMRYLNAGTGARYYSTLGINQNATNVEVPYTGMELGFLLDGDGTGTIEAKFSAYEGGSMVHNSANYVGSITDALMGIRRTGSVWDKVQSVDGGATWSSVYTFSYTYTGDVWIVGDVYSAGMIFEPQCNNAV
jgi:hypothetical protein